MRQALAQMKGMTSSLPHSRNSVRPMSTYRFSQSQFSTHGSSRTKRQSATTSSWNPLSLTLPSDSSLNTSGPEPDTTSCDEFGPNQQRLRGSRISGMGGGKDRSSFSSSFNRPRSQFREPNEKISPIVEHDFDFSSSNSLSKRDSGLETKRVSRVAVPSMLLKSLGDLPSLPNSNTSAATLGKSANQSPETSFTPILDLGLDIHSSVSGTLEDELDFEIEKSMWLSSTLATQLDQVDQEKLNSKNQFGSNAGLGIGEGEKGIANLGRQGSINAKRTETKESQSSRFNTSNRSLLSNSSLGVRRPSMADEVRSRSGTVSTARSTNLSGSGPSNDSVYCSAASISSTPVKHKFGSGSLPPLPSSSFDAKRPSHVAVNFPESPTRNRSSYQVPLDSNSGFRPLSLGLSLSSSSKSSLGAIFKNARMNPWGGDGVEEEEEPEEEEDLEKKAGKEQENLGNRSLDYNRSIYGDNSILSHGNRSLEYSTGDDTTTSASHTRGGFSFSQESHHRMEASYSSPPSSTGSLSQSRAGSANASANGCNNDDLEGVMDAKVEKASIIQVSTPNLSAAPAMPVRRVSPAFNPQPSHPAPPAAARRSLEKPVDLRVTIPKTENPKVQSVPQARSVSRSTTIPRPSSVRKSSFTEDGKVQLPPSPNLSVPTTAQVLQKAQSDPGFETVAPAPIQVQAAQSTPSFSPSPLSSSFISPYHHAVFPELSEEDKEMITRKSISGDACPSPILAQIGLVTSPTMQDSAAADSNNQPHLSPRPSFGESLRARFSRSKPSSANSSSSMLSGVAVGITEQQQSTLVTPKSSRSDLSVTPPAPTSRPSRSPKSPNRPTSTANSTSSPNHSALATPVLPFAKSSSASVENSPFEAPPTTEWRVSTDGREDNDDADFLPKVTVCGPAVRRGSGAGGIGLGLSDASDAAADFSKIIQQAKAITASAASRPERRSQVSTISKGSSSATRPMTTSPSNSPIMQQSHWALSSPIQSSSDPLAQGDSNQSSTSPSSSSTLTSQAKEIVVLPMLQRKPSKDERASWSPLELVQHRFSGVGVAMGGDEYGSSSEASHQSQSLRAVHEIKTLSPRSAYELVRSPSPRSEQTWFGSTAQIQNTYSTPKPLNARSSRQLWNSDCVSPRSDGGADTISLASSHSCMTIGTETGLGLAGEGLENGNGAADRRARLLQSVQENAAKEIKKGHRENAKSKRQVQEEDSLESQQQGETNKNVAAPNFALPLKKPAHLFIDSSRNPSGSRALEEARNKGLNMNPLMSPLTPPLTPADSLLHQQQSNPRRPSAEISVPRPTKLRPLSLTASTILGDSTNSSNPHSFNPKHSQNVTPPLNRVYPHSPSTRSISASLSSSSSSSLDVQGANSSSSPRKPLMLSKEMEQRERAKQVRMSRGLADGTGGILPTISPKAFDYSPVIGGNSRRPSLNLLQEET